MQKFLSAFLVFGIAATALAREMPTAVWRTQFRKSFPPQLCKNPEVRASFRRKVRCIRAAADFTSRCLVVHQREMPDIFGSPEDKQEWEAKIAECARVKLLTAMKSPEIARRLGSSEAAPSAPAPAPASPFSGSYGMFWIFGLVVLVFVAIKGFPRKTKSPRRRKSKRKAA